MNIQPKIAADAPGLLPGPPSPDPTDPLCDALIFLAASHGRTISREDLIAGLPIQGDRLTVTLVEQAALRAGLETEVVKWNLTEIPGIVLPVILVMKHGATRILTSAGKDPKVIDPSQPLPEPVSIGADAQDYLGYAFLVRPLSQPAERRNTTAGHPFWSIARRWENVGNFAAAALLLLAIPLLTNAATPQPPEREVALAPGLFERRWFDPEFRVPRIERRASDLHALDTPRLDLSTSTSVYGLSDATALVPTTIARSREPFGMQATRAPEGVLWQKWRALANELGDEDEQLISCKKNPKSCTAAAAQFWSMVGKVRIARGKAQLERVNDLVNLAITYTTDLANDGQLDKWSAPLATLRLGKGDCEDYAILKYRLLAQAGVPSSDLRIILLRDTALRIDHAVLAARTEGTWFILDNRGKGFFSERDLPHYMPLVALDQSGVNRFAAPFASLPANSAGQAILPGLNDDARRAARPG